MKSSHFLPLILITSILTACSSDNKEPLLESIKNEVTSNIETDMNKAIADAKADLTDINVTLADGSKAKIASNGDLTVNGAKVTLNAEQRALSVQYYAATKKIAMQGMEIGKESAKLATQAIGSAIGGIINGKNEAEIEKSIEAKAGNIEAVAMKLCDSALQLKNIQVELMAAVPEFKPEPMTVDKQEDGCHVQSADNNAAPEANQADTPVP